MLTPIHSLTPKQRPVRATPPDAAAAAFGAAGPFAALPEPALLIGPGGVLLANAAGQDLSEDAGAIEELVRISAAAEQGQAAIRQILHVAGAERDALIEFDVAPWSADCALVLGRDITVSAGVREALEISRERYRALLTLAVDCIWETGADGRIELLAPNDIFGRPAATLIGRPLQDLIVCRAPGFHAARGPAGWTSAGATGANGEILFGSAIVEPILEPDSRRRHGARGCFRRA